MANRINANLPQDKELAHKVLDTDIEIAKIEMGLLGRLWGNALSIPNNIAALSIVLLLMVGVGYTFLNFNKNTADISFSIKDMWATIMPFMTLSLGYLFGDYSSKKRERK